MARGFKRDWKIKYKKNNTLQNYNNNFMNASGKCEKKTAIVQKTLHG